MTEYDVNIKVPNAEKAANAIILKGLRSKIDAIKPVLAKRLEELDAGKAVRFDPHTMLFFVPSYNTAFS